MRSSYRTARDYVQLGFSRGLEKQREHHFADSRFRKMPREIDISSAAAVRSASARLDGELDQNPENWRAQKISVASSTRVHTQLDMQSHSPTIIWCELQLRRPYECHVKSRRGLPMLAALPRRTRAATVNAHYALPIAIMPTFLPL
uniref:Uncharacterized protein n=1 Tax=Trichogramma kaykai TaxID=54128 RepID=A0ABD2X0X1_9HYME